MTDPTQRPAVARADRITRRYGEGPGAVVALQDITLELGLGEFTAIMGPSGSGKSTLMHIMAGLDAPTSGRAFLGDTEITQLGDTALTELRRSRVGFVFQAFNLIPVLDVAANIRLPFDLGRQAPTVEQRAWIDRLVQALGIGHRLDHRPSQLSGGEQQRVAIARALATRPDLVFADEPTGNLDSRTGREVLSLLAAASTDHGQSIAMVTHDPVAASYASRVVFLSDGQVVRDSGRLAPEEIAQYMLTLGQEGQAGVAGQEGQVGVAVTTGIASSPVHTESNR